MSVCAHGLMPGVGPQPTMAWVSLYYHGLLVICKKCIARRFLLLMALLLWLHKDECGACVCVCSFIAYIGTPLFVDSCRISAGCSVAQHGAPPRCLLAAEWGTWRWDCCCSRACPCRCATYAALLVAKFRGRPRWLTALVQTAVAICFMLLWDTQGQGRNATTCARVMHMSDNLISSRTLSVQRYTCRPHTWAHRRDPALPASSTDHRA